MVEFSTVRVASILVGFISILPNQSEAGLTIYHGDWTVESKTVGFDGNEVQIGDIYHWQFTLDDSAVDDDPSVSRGNFYDNFRDVFFVPAATNVGTWNPLPVPLANDVSQTNTFPGNLNVVNVVEGNGSAVTLYGNSVTQFQMDNLFLADINDTGVGQTWGEQVSNLRSNGGMNIVYGSNPLDGSREFFRMASNGFGVGRNPAIAVPEPSGVALVGMSCMAFLSGSRNRARKCMRLFPFSK